MTRFAFSPSRFFPALVGCMLLLGGCATPPPVTDKDATAEYQQVNDPAEPTNRTIFEFNQALDKAVFKPVAQGYRAAVPDPLRDRAHDFLTNLRAPWVFANDVMQGEIARAWETLFRFCINTSFGLFGAIDFAGAAGLQGHDEDFGQTMAVWGIPEGPYVMLPVLGPSNPRDTVGLVVEFFFDPANYVMRRENMDIELWSRTVVTAVDKRERLLDPLDEMEKSSIDYYSSIRSLYRQKRDAEIRNGRDAGKMPSPGATFDFDAPADTATLENATRVVTPVRATN